MTLMEYYTRPSGEVLKELQSDPAVGLNSAQVTERKEKYGENALEEKTV